MKTAKRRVLSFLMALFVMVTTVCGHVDYTVAAEETNTTIAAWEYTAAPETDFPLAATTGSGTLSMTSGLTFGGYSSKSLKATGWKQDEGWIMSIDASAYSNLGFTASLRSSKTGPANMELQYSLDDGTTWMDIVNSTVILTGTNLTKVYNNFTLPGDLNNKTFMLKVNTADGVSVNGGTIDATNGAGNINSIIITGSSGSTESTEGSETTVPSETTTQAPTEAPTEAPATTAVADGKYVIYNPASGKAFSQTMNGYYNAGVDMKLNASGKFDTVAETEVWTVTNNADGTITISCTEGNLSMDTEFTSTPIGKANDKWVLKEGKTAGTYYVENVAREAFLQWYAAKDYFSAYYKIAEGSEGNFEMQFVPVETAGTPEDTEKPGDTETPSGTAVADGKYVIYNPASGKAFSQTMNGYYNAGVDMKLNASGKFDTVAETEVWTVTNNADGTITISCAEGNLSMDTEFTSTPIGKANDKWVLKEGKTAGTYYVENVVREASLQWYAAKDYFSAYYKIAEGSEGNFEMQFVPVETAGTPEDTEKPGDTETPSGTAVADGKYVIYNPASGKAFSQTMNGYYNAGVDMKLNASGKFDTVAETEVWTVKNNADGTITISCAEGNLSMDTEFTSTPIGKANDKWVLKEGKTAGTYYVENLVREASLQWYAAKNYFSAYYKIAEGSEGNFEMQFVPVTVAGESNKVTSAADFTTGTYAMVVETGYAPGVLEGTWVTAVQPTIEGDTLTDAAGGVWTLTVTGNTVKITDSNLATIKPKGGNNNGIASGSYDWVWSFNEETGTFSFAGQGSDTVKFASNLGSENKFRGYKLSTLTGSYASEYKSEFTLYKVEASSSVVTPDEGSKVVIYNVNAKGVLAGQDDNTDSPSINNVSATIGEDGKVTVANGGVVFEIVKNGNFFRFYNETYGYLCSRDTGNNAYYSLEACDEADWSLEALGKGFKMKNKVAKYNGTGDQYLEYYADSYKTYSFYGTNKDGTPADTTIYEFHFLECANTDLTGGIVNAPVAVVETVLDANVGIDYTFTFEVDAPFGVKELTVTVNGEAVDYTEAAGIYTVVIPAAKVVGEKLEIVVSGKDNKEVAITGTFNVTVKDEPGVANVTPAAGSETGDNKKPVISAEITNAGENATVVMTINEEKVDAVYADGKVTYTSATDMADGRYNVTVTVTRADGKVATKTWSFTVGKAQFQLYFGQLHSHTTYSDGSGSLESALNYIASLPESANVDFVAFTDHSNYFDTTSAVNPEQALYDMSLASADSQALWNAYKSAVAEFNASQSKVVALGGFEMTWSGGPGHINTFNTPGIVSRNNKTLNNKTSDAGMKAYYALLSQAEGAESLSQFNHPGSTFGTFTDFSYWDALLDTRIQMVEVGNGEGAIGAGGYFPSYEYYTMALDKGWHLAPTNNQDNHKGKWGNANDARDVVLTDNFTEEGIYQAIRDMRMYATEDKNLEIYYTANGFQLGSTIDEVPETLAISVDLYDPDASDSISKVEVIVNSGKAAYTWDKPSELATGNLTCELDPVYSYYYIRVTQGDGDLAVTAPVWVGETLKLGISAVECGTSTPVTGEEVTLTTTLFNSEAESAFVKALTYTVNGSEVIGTDTKGYNIPASGTESIDFKFTPADAKLTKVTVTAVVEQGKVEYTFTMDITLDVQDSEKLVYIGIDAAHYNEYVAGNYADSMGNFSQLAAGYSVRTVELKTCEDLIAACSNSKFKAIIMTAPSRRLAASWTDPRTYSAEEIAAIKAFNDNGGTVILASWSDHYESPSKTGNTSGVEFKHMAATQNEVLEALGSSLRINDDATYDDSYNGGQQYRLYFNTYGDNFLTEGVEVDPENPHDRLYTEVFSHYGGASVYVVDGEGKATTTIPSTVSPVVYGHASTYSVDADEDGIGGEATPKYTYAEGDDRLLVMAMEQKEGKGAIIVSGAAFMSNFEVQATIEDSGSEKNYSNYRICENLVQYVNPVKVTPIAEVQAQKEVGYKYTIEGIVTTNASGYDKDTAFFDCIYVQDETGGVCCFPVAGNYKIGDKVRVTGTTEFYQGEMELQVTDIEVIGSGTVAAKKVTASEINDLSVLGQLVTLSGTVVSFEMANGLVQTIMVKDAAGNVARVFIDGYITTAKDVQNLAVGRAITVTGVSSFDDTFNAPNGPFPRIRVKDRADVICTTVSVPSTPAEPETEAPSTEAPTTKPGTSTQKPSTEENTTTTPDTSTEPVEVIIPVEGTVAEQTEAIVEAIEEVKAGNNVVIKVEDTEDAEVAVSVEVFKALEENESVDLVVELANGFTWTIDAGTVDTSKVEAGLEAINLWAGIVENVVPEEVVSLVTNEENEVLELSLKHNGEFGFTAALDVPVGKEFAGKNASLYYYNPETSALEAQELATIDENGFVRFTFTHASDYVVVIEKEAEKAPVDTEVNTEAPVDTEVNTEAPANTEEKGGSPVVAIVLVLLAVAAGCFAFAYSKKKK